MSEIRYAQVENDNVAYRDFGGDGPPIVYVSGAMVPIEVMEDDPVHARFLRGLWELGRLYVFDRRGIGASDPPDWDRPLIPQWTDDIIAVLDTASIDQATLVGYEAGAGAALRAAFDHPGRVTRLVLFHGPPGDAQSWRLLTDGWQERMSDVVARDLDAGEMLVKIAMPSRVDDPAFRDWLDRAGRIGASPATAGRIWSAIFETSADSDAFDVSSVQTPSLVLHRADCGVIPASGSHALAERLPNARLSILPGADFAPYSGDVDGLIAEIAAFVTGEHRTPAPDRPMLAVLFTDLVGSTQQVASAGDSRWRGVLDRHDDLVRSVLGRHGGTLIKTTGDGALATFATATRAIRGAIDLRAELAGAGLDVRIGIHAGEVDRRGDDVAGIAVHIAARLMGEAAPGEILVSDAVPMLTLGGNLAFESRGTVRLKGLDGKWRVHRLRT